MRCRCPIYICIRRRVPSPLKGQWHWRDYIVWEMSDREKHRKWLPFYQSNYCLLTRVLISYRQHTRAHIMTCERQFRFTDLWSQILIANTLRNVIAIRIIMRFLIDPNQRNKAVSPDSRPGDIIDRNKRIAEIDSRLHCEQFEFMCRTPEWGVQNVLHSFTATETHVPKSNETQCWTVSVLSTNQDRRKNNYSIHICLHRKYSSTHWAHSVNSFASKSD